MLREIRLNVILLVVVTVVIAILILNATAEFGPLKTGELGVPPNWEASQDVISAETTPEVTQEATIEATEDIEAPSEATADSTEEAADGVTEEPAS